MSQQLQTRWYCRACGKEWVGRGNWSPVNVYNPETGQIEAWDELHCVNWQCRSTQIGPITFVGERGFDIPRDERGQPVGHQGAVVSGFDDLLGVVPERQAEPPVNPTMLLAEAEDIPSGSIYDLSDMD